MVLARLPIENSLTALDLSMIGGLNDPRGAHMPNFQSIKLVVDKCRKLTDLILMDTRMSFQSITYVRGNVTNKMQVQKVMSQGSAGVCTRCTRSNALPVSDVLKVLYLAMYKSNWKK